MRRGGSNVTCGAIALGSHEDTGGLFVFAYCVCGVAAAMSLVVQFVLGVHKEAGGLFVFAKFVCGVAAAMSLLRSPSCSVVGGDTAYIVASCRFVWVAGSRDVVCLTHMLWRWGPTTSHTTFLLLAVHVQFAWAQHPTVFHLRPSNERNSTLE
jgi:hypothetical protein